MSFYAIHDPDTGEIISTGRMAPESIQLMADGGTPIVASETQPDPRTQRVDVSRQDRPLVPKEPEAPPDGASHDPQQAAFRAAFSFRD